MHRRGSRKRGKKKKKEHRERGIPVLDINNFRLKYQYFLQRVAAYWWMTSVTGEV
jgi:hypothetical protein